VCSRCRFLDDLNVFFVIFGTGEDEESKKEEGGGRVSIKGESMRAAAMAALQVYRTAVVW